MLAKSSRVLGQDKVDHKREGEMTQAPTLLAFYRLPGPRGTVPTHSPTGSVVVGSLLSTV